MQCFPASSAVPAGDGFATADTAVAHRTLAVFADSNAASLSAGKAFLACSSSRLFTQQLPDDLASRELIRKMEHGFDILRCSREANLEGPFCRHLHAPRHQVVHTENDVHIGTQSVAKLLAKRRGGLLFHQHRSRLLLREVLVPRRLLFRKCQRRLRLLHLGTARADLCLLHRNLCVDVLRVSLGLAHRGLGKPDSNLDSYDLYLRALALSHQFTPESLSEAVTLQRSARLLAGEIADWVIIDIERGGRLLRQFAAGPRGGQSDQLARVARDVDPDQESLPALVHSTGKSVLHAHPDDPAALGHGPGGEKLGRCGCFRRRAISRGGD